MNWFGLGGGADRHLRVDDVFSTTVIAPESYLDRSKNSDNAVTRRKIRILKQALVQPGIQVCVYGESKSGKTMFAIKTAGELGRGFIVVEGAQVTSVDSFWRQVAESLKLNIQRDMVDGSEKGTQTLKRENGGLQFGLGGVGLNAKFAESREVQALTKVEIKTEIISSVRRTCLDVLAAAQMSVILDDFHLVSDAAARRDILMDTKIPSGLKQGKFVFISIPPSSFLEGPQDEQLKGRTGLYEFPVWSGSDLKAIARHGFRRLGIGISEKHVSQIQETSFFNPFNVQQICMHVCAVCNVARKADVKAAFKLTSNNIEDGLSDFAHSLNYFRWMTEKAKTISTTSKDNKKQSKWRVGKDGPELNMYELVFLALSTPDDSGEFGITTATLKARIKAFTGLNLTNLDRVAQWLADMEVNYDNQDPHPVVYDKAKQKLFVNDPKLRFYLLRAYLPEIGIDPEELRKMLPTKATA